MDSKHKAIVKTLLYSSLFSFPLREDELYRYLHTSHPLSLSQFRKSLRTLSSYIYQDDGYYALRENRTFIPRRKAMEEEVRRKREEAFSTARLLCKIPTIYFIGISGGLAAGSATEGDDIDLFIITKKKTMFISRLLALLLLQVVGKRRKRGEKNAPNKMCLNMWLDTSELQFTTSQQDLYTAREIAQLLPLYDRGGTYQMFLRSNSWIKIFLPHAFLFPFRPRHSMNSNTFMERLMGVFEFPSKLLQLYSIKRHQTTEIVTEHALLFHPRDYRQRILKEYAIKIAKDVKLL